VTALWKSHLIALGAAIFVIVAVFHRDAADLVSIWWNISTYNHAIFIIPIVGWLIWQRAAEVKLLTPRGWWPGLIGIAVAGFGWMLGEAGGISLFRHAAIVLMVQSAALTILGPTVLRGLLFPVFYLVFLIPIGDEAVPLLQTITADMCMFLLGVIGIPAHIEGVFITTPVGLFEVAEACSGVKFLVAMIAYSALVANVCFTSWKRRILFLIMAFIVPILANGLRAFGTIWVSELTGNVEFAASVDHIIFGWVFFAVVMLLVMAIGWRWFDRSVDDAWIPDVSNIESVWINPWPRAAGVASVLVSAFLLQTGLSSLGQRPMNRMVAMPEIKGWKRAAIVQSYPWNARFDGADHYLSGQYVNSKGERVDLAIALYAWQGDGREMVGYAQGAFDPRTRWSWVSSTDAPPGGKADRIFAPGASREVASFYWTGGALTGSGTRVKLETLKSRLIGKDQASVAILVSAEDGKLTKSRPAIDAFLSDLGPVEVLASQLVSQSRMPS
jgi:exosortase A